MIRRIRFNCCDPTIEYTKGGLVYNLVMVYLVLLTQQAKENHRTVIKNVIDDMATLLDHENRNLR